jgi:ubiquinol-cytochrome c reductase cytochrome c1 subunit
MPHALWELQGKRVPVFETHGVPGHETQVLKGWEQLTPGTMTPAQYDQAVGDLVNYLQWMAEPGQDKRVQLGYWVLAFLAVMTIFTYKLNGAYWKDVK